MAGSKCEACRNANINSRWLPNQLMAVMALMKTIYAGLTESDRANAGKTVTDIMENVADQSEKLDKEVQRWCQERGV